MMLSQQHVQDTALRVTAPVRAMSFGNQASGGSKQKGDPNIQYELTKEQKYSSICRRRVRYCIHKRDELPQATLIILPENVVA